MQIVVDGGGKDCTFSFIKTLKVEVNKLQIIPKDR